MKITLADLEQVAKSLSIKVSYDDLKTSKEARAGSWRPAGSSSTGIFRTEKDQPPGQELGHFDLSGLDVSGRIGRRSKRKRTHGPAPDRCAAGSGLRLCCSDPVAERGGRV
jgi:hypothetical protein